MKMRFLILLLLGWMASPAFVNAATYFVSKSGSDLNDGSEIRPFLTIQKAANVVLPGDTVRVGPGTFAELVNLARTASPTGPITFRGDNTEVGGFNCRKSDYVLQGFKLNGSLGVMAKASALVYAYPATHRLQILDNSFYNATNKYGVWLGLGANTAYTNSSSYCVVSNNTFTFINYINVFCSGQSNRFVRNLFKDSVGQADCFRLWGQGHVASENVVTNLNMRSEGHTDFYQVFGPDGATSASQYNYARDIVFERNYVINSRIQICQLENFDNPVGYMTNIIFRNNFFINLPYAANVDIDGTKWFNNVFYRVNVDNGGHVFAMGGRKGSAYGTEIKNNQFIECGNGKDWSGWYPVVGMFGISNYDIQADYNYVCGPGYARKRTGADGWGAQGNEVNGINGGDPGIASIVDLDFRLASGSPLINAGLALAGFSDDYQGKPRSDGSWDIGPIEADSTGVQVNARPTVELVSPLNGISLFAPAAFTVEATASDRDGTVTRVEFLNGDQVLGQAAAAPYRVNLSGLSTGTYSLTARATDNMGATSLSQVVVVTVNADGSDGSGGASGRVYYVAMSGNDSNLGSASNPWRTVQKAVQVAVAGDTVLVGPGNYSESLATRVNGTETQPIRFLANPPNNPSQQVILRQFRVRHRHHVIEGFNFTGSQDLNAAAIRIESNPPTADGSHTVVRNNTIRDGVYLMSDDLRFNHLDNSITTAKGDWLSRGFLPGGYVYLGSSSKTPYVNHDTAWRIKAVTANTLYVTNNAGSAFQVEPQPTVWGVIYAGNGNTGYSGVEMILGNGTTAATNCVIVGNTFSNLFGCPVRLHGRNHLVANNSISRIHGYPGIQIQGSNQIIRRNLWKDCTNFMFFTLQETLTIPHPEGSNFYDYQSAFFASFVNESTNILVEQNWFQNIDSQMGLISHAEGSRGYTIRSNVFVGIQAQMSCSRSGVTVENNTYYRCSFDENRSHPLAFGGVGGNIQSDLIVRKNVFVDCGSHKSPDNEGYYTIQNSVNYLVDENFVSSSETMGFSAKRFFNEPNGLNGGDPSFLDPSNPLGPDGIPFTADDGLRPLANSPFVTRGWGALEAYQPAPSSPVAHFAVTSPSGWFELTGVGYNRAWYLLEPYQRGENVRPYTTPEALGIGPIEVTFSAESSLDGLASPSTTNAGIRMYRWDFGDGTALDSAVPTAKHTFAKSGKYIVSLRVVNSAGATHSISRAYKVLDATGNPPGRPKNFRAVGGN